MKIDVYNHATTTGYFTTASASSLVTLSDAGLWLSKVLSAVYQAGDPTNGDVIPAGVNDVVPLPGETMNVFVDGVDRIAGVTGSTTISTRASATASPRGTGSTASRWTGGPCGRSWLCSSRQGPR